MREILFRGKDLVGNWEYGSSVTNRSEGYAFSKIITDEGTEVLVDPETVTQFVGELDIDGEDI